MGWQWVALMTLVSAAETWTVYNENHVPVKNGSAVAGANVMTPVQQLTNAIAQAAADSTIVIKPGTYDLAAELTAAKAADTDTCGLSYLVIDRKKLYIKGEDTTHWSQKTAAQETVLKGGSGGRIIYGYAGIGRSSVFQHLTFEGGTAPVGKYGGAIAFLGTENCQPFVSGYASNCVFRSNSAGMSGGATAYVSVYDSFFTNNVAGQGGAAFGTSQYGSYRYTNDFISCVFVDNVMTNATSGGGALYCAIPGRLEGCTFVANRTANNGAKGLGGAIYSEKGIPRIFKCTFTNNVAANGGAIYTVSSLNELAVSTFVANRTANNGAAGSGGAIYSETDIPRIFKCAFTNNVAATGGAIYIKGSKLNELAESTFVGNRAKNNASLYANGGYGTITGCTFKDNVAQDLYAGVAAPSMALAGTVENCIFDNNTNKVTNVGSQIRFAQQVTGCTFKGAGDMMALNYDRCLFDGCLFDYENYGGGMILYDSNTGVGHLRNCLFQNNTMHVAIDNATGEMLEIANCTFVSNRVIRSVNVQSKAMSNGYLIFAFRGQPAGSSSQLPSTNRVVNCAFYNNYRHKTGSDEMERNDVNFYATTYVTGFPPAGNILDHCYYETATFPSGSAYTPIQIDNVTNVAPKFVAGDARYPDAPYYMPRRSSPLRNAGQYLDWMESAVDFAGNARVRDGQVDAGCYESALPVEGCMIIFR